MNSIFTEAPVNKVQISCNLEPCCLNRLSLQKQVGCFNHRVVTLVADKLERQWLPEVFFGMEV